MLLPQVVCIPFAWFNEAVTPITYDSQDWIGSIGEGQGWYYADYMLLLIFGGIPWQVSRMCIAMNSQLFATY
jgi:high affinity choline transporter 7